MSTMDFVSDHGWSVFLSTFGEVATSRSYQGVPLCRKRNPQKGWPAERRLYNMTWGTVEKAGEGSMIRCIDKKERVEPQGCLPACLPPRPPIHAPECSPFCLYVRKSISFSFPSPRPNYTTMIIQIQTSSILPFYRISLTAPTHPHTQTGRQVHLTYLPTYFIGGTRPPYLR